ncbi:MAG: hypothetical protein AAGJ46_08135 [Planctomycetota bacterium]
MQRSLPRRWVWTLAVLFFPVLYIAVFQRGRLQGPDWLGWTKRAVAAAAVVLGLLALGGSPWLNSEAVFQFRVEVMSLFTPEISSVIGRAIGTVGGGSIATSELTHLFAAPVAVASLAVVAGAMQYYGPVFKSIVLAAVFITCSAATSIVTEAWMIDAFSKGSSLYPLIDRTRIAFDMYLWCLAVFVAALAWAWFDTRDEARHEAATVDPVIEEQANAAA